MKGSEVFISLQQQQKERMNERKKRLFFKVASFNVELFYEGTKLSVNKGLSFFNFYLCLN